MARHQRFFVRGHVLHVIQRGNNRVPIFGEDADYRFFCNCLLHAIRLHGVTIHAYVLMTNHIHLLASPAHAMSISRALQAVGRRYVQWFNTAYARTGTLWEGRYRASVIDSERYLLTCMRYIELNPVRAGIVANPADYVWSSYHSNAEGSPSPLVSPHALYARMGASDADRQASYRALFGHAPADDELARIRDATHNNWALGDEDFAHRIEYASRRPAMPAKPGRRALPLASRP